MQVFKMSVLDLVAGHVDRLAGHVDRLAGHVDRHAGNYMIDQKENGEVKLTAIDNDTAFGERTDIESGKDLKGEEERPALEEAFPFVPQEILDSTMAVTKEDLEEALMGLLSGPQIEAACERLRKVQEWFKLLEEEKIPHSITQAWELRTPDQAQGGIFICRSAPEGFAPTAGCQGLG